MTFYKPEDNQERNKYCVDCQAAIEAGEEIRVEQNHKAETDINNIVKKHAGNLELISKNAELIGFDMDDIPTNDFAEMQNIMIKAKQAFESVPSAIRSQFDHNPALYMDFIRNPENADKLVEMGLAHKREEPDTSPIEVVIKEQSPPSE